MGGLMTCLLARKILQHGYTAPIQLFVTGTYGPSAAARAHKRRHLLGKKQFLDEIRKLDGSRNEILQNEELMNYFEPILRADFTATENFQYKEAPAMDIPLTVITGMDEEMIEDDIRTWQRETTREVDFRKMPGNHFFIFNYAKQIVEIITGKLLPHAKNYQL
jgi:surfactin synthase thioesterase subunit